MIKVDFMLMGIQKAGATSLAAQLSEDPAYINRSRHRVQTTPYIELFDRERVLLLAFEEYAADQQRALQAIAEYLGVSIEDFKVTIV